MNKTVTLIVGAVLIIGIGGFVFWQKQETNEEQAALQAAQQAQQEIPENTSADSETTTPSTGTKTAASYSSADVAKHNSRSSCWSSINGSVYDLTSWIPKHPGGEQAILKLCGTNGSEEFNEQHGGAALQAQILAGFKIGVAK